MVKFLFYWILAPIVSLPILVMIVSKTAATTTSPFDLLFVMVLLLSSSIFVPIILLLKLGWAALLIRSAARQWYSGRDQHARDLT
jgi:hypothetical protein